MERTKHVPVLMDEVMSLIDVVPGMTVVDATLGGGGYTQAIYQKIMPGGMLIACDQDSDAIERFREHHADIAGEIHLVHSNYSHIRKVLKDSGCTHVDAIVADLGLSSDQITETDRGFSFSSDGALDMRMNRHNKVRAHDIVNDLREEELAEIIAHGGEERYARRIAHAICANRPITSPRELARVIEKVVRQRTRGIRKIHPATTAMQAIRIAVNDEYAHLRTFLTEGMNILSRGGRFAVVSFHSGEDRLVKNVFRTNARGCICDPELPVCHCEHEPQVRLLTKKPITPSEREIARNPRSRSARLRGVEKL